MTAPCTRCGRDCDGVCLELAEGTHPGAILVGRRVVVTYPYVHIRKGESPITEIRCAFGTASSVLSDGSLWVVTDREGGMRVEPEDAEVVQ